MTYNFGGIDSRMLSGGELQYNIHTIQEVVVETAAGSAEATTGGVQINIIPKDGGNTFSGSVSTEITGPELQSDNLTDELRARGLTSAAAVRRYHDVGGGLGGPIKQDKAVVLRSPTGSWTESLYQAGNYYNKRQGTRVLRARLEPARPTPTISPWTPRFASRGRPRQSTRSWFNIHQQPILPVYVSAPGADQVPRFAPEAVARAPLRSRSTCRRLHYTSPLTNRLLVEADSSKNSYHRSQQRQQTGRRPAVTPSRSRIRD